MGKKTFYFLQNTLVIVLATVWQLAWCFLPLSCLLICPLILSVMFVQLTKSVTFQDKVPFSDGPTILLRKFFLVLVWFFFFRGVFLILKQIWLHYLNTHFPWIFSLFQWLQYYWEADGTSLLVSCHPDRMMDVSTWKIFILFYIALRCFLAPTLKLTQFGLRFYGSSRLCAFIRLNVAYTHSVTTSHFVSYFFPCNYREYSTYVHIRAPMLL